MTLLDDATMSDEYRERIMENRRYYASKQGRNKSIQSLSDANEGFGQATARSFHKSVNMTLAIPQEAGLWYQVYGTR